jgi:membrane associated rhomboid family serine protease
MIPIRDDNPTFLKPVITLALIAANVATWALVQGLGTPDALVSSVCELGLLPGEVTGAVPPGTLVQLSDQKACLTQTGVWYTPLTSMFLHGGWLHLAGNLWFLWIFGNNVEDAMGHGRFLLFYLVCGLVAAALQVASQPTSVIPMVGASGAIGGVMGAYVVLYPRVRVHMLFILGFYVTTIAVPALWMLGYWLLIQLVGGAASIGKTGGGTAFWAHVGGFVAGGVLIFLFRNRRLLDQHPFHGWRARPPGPAYERHRGVW